MANESHASVLVQKLDPRAQLPRQMTALAAGHDLRACLETPLRLPPGGRVAVPTGLAIALPAGCEAQVRPRSGLAWKHGVTVLNAPGTVDADYRGELKVLLINHGEQAFDIEHGDRIAQLVVARVHPAQFEERSSLPEPASARSGGFGSTGRE